MIPFQYIAAFAAVTSAAVIRRDQCCFQITASGGVSGLMGQLDDGQNRLNGTYPAATYCYSNGGITDAHGRGCIVTITNDATHQFQCDEGTAPYQGFSISSNGSLAYQGSNRFYACPYNNGDIIEYNVYSRWLTGQDKCRPVMLSTGGTCGVSNNATGSLSSPTAYSAPAYSAPALSESNASSPTTSSSPVVPVYGVQTTPSAYSPQSYETAPVQSYNLTATSSTPLAPEYKPTYSEIVVPSYATQKSIAYETAPPNAYISLIATASQSKATEYSQPAVAYTITSTVQQSIPAYSQPVVSYESSSPAASIAPSFTSNSTAPGSTSTTLIAPEYSQLSSTVPTTTASESVCQTALTGAYQTPHLIVPISSSSPDTAYGTQYNATINSTTSTIFNFDIPADYAGKTCTTIFLFPELADLETSSYTFSGSGSLAFSQLSGVATQQTTWNNAPSVNATLDTIAIQAGNSYVVASGACSAGVTGSIELSSENGLTLEFFEDWNPSSLGLYITAC